MSAMENLRSSSTASDEKFAKFMEKRVSLARRRSSALESRASSKSNSGKAKVSAVVKAEEFITRTAMALDNSECAHGEKKLLHRWRTRKTDLRIHLRCVARFVIVAQRMSKEYILENRENDEMAPFISHLTFHFDMEPSDLFFDPNKFRADRQMRVPEDIRLMLCKKISNRTEKELYAIQLNLRNCKAFSDYPIRMQKLIARVGMYERYDAKRIIVRQGHRAQSFYFILSGSIVVMVMDYERQFARPVAFLEKGMTFGELAIINRTTRQSTCIAKEAVELLSISIEDFHNIFMSGGVKNILDPDHNAFINKLEFLKSWPVHLLAENPSKCVFHYFKPGTVMAKDTNYNNWLYVVKTGSISVIKKLKKAYPSMNIESSNTERPNTKEVHELHDAERIARKTERMYTRPLVRVPARSETMIAEEEESESESEDEAPPKIKIEEHEKISQKTPDNKQETEHEHGDLTKSELEEAERKVEKQKEMMGFKQEIRTIADDFDAGYNAKDGTEFISRPHLVQVQVLREEQVFGLVQCIFPSQPRFTLVSNGAECVMIDKEFFLAHCPIDLKNEVTTHMTLYPTDDDMQNTLQQLVNWRQFKSDTFARTLVQKTNEKTSKEYLRKGLLKFANGRISVK